jgi:microcystin-dependent protein
MTTINNDQQTIVLNQLVVESGVFPSFGGSPTEDPGGIPMGTIRTFAIPNSGIAGQADQAAGQLHSISQQTALFSILGTTYGGDGVRTFGLPDLAGTVAVGVGNGPSGQVSWGETYGQDSTTLTRVNMPTGAGGSDLPYNNDQPSLAVNYMINVGGNGTALDAPGMVVPFLGDFAPAGYMLAEGQILPIAQYQSLYNAIGNTYGGSASQGTFALPNLSGRTIIGADDGTGSQSPSEPLGTVTGTDTTTLTQQNLPLSGDLPVDNQQPTLALNYMIFIGNGLFFPSSGALSNDTPYLGEIMAYAGNAHNLPPGWVLAAGQTLSIDANQVLFSAIGTTYGGNGFSTFQLPNLQDTVVAGAGTNRAGTTYAVGETYGVNSYSLNNNELPANQAPSVTLGTAGYSTPEQQALELKGTGISVADPDGGTGIETLTISVSEGTLHATVGDSFVTVQSGNDSSALALRGTIAELNALLGQGGTSDLTFIDNTNTPTSVTLTLGLNDNGNTGSGGARSSINEQTTVDVTPCYCPGTLIKTARGDAPVEALKIGDEVMTASGVMRPIKWIGRRSYAGRFVMGRKDILPVCIKAGALDANVPRRDLWISPHHAMYFEDPRGGVLIEAKNLVNGTSIVQAEQADKVEYVHVELDTHDVIIAEGALSETYLDEDNRLMFHNAQDYHARYRDAAGAPGHYCAPRLEEGYEIESVRQHIAARAGSPRNANGEQIHIKVHRRTARA